MTPLSLSSNECKWKKQKRLVEEPKWRNQFISAELPTLPYVPHIQPGPDSKYRMEVPE